MQSGMILLVVGIIAGIELEAKYGVKERVGQIVSWQR